MLNKLIPTVKLTGWPFSRWYVVRVDSKKGDPRELYHIFYFVRLKRQTYMNLKEFHQTPHLLAP